MKRWFRRVATHASVALLAVVFVFVAAEYFDRDQNRGHYSVMPLLRAIERGDVGLGAEREALFTSGLLLKTDWFTLGADVNGVNFERRISSSRDASGSRFLIDLYFEGGKLFAAAAIRGYDDERWYFCDHDAMRRFVESRAFGVVD